MAAMRSGVSTSTLLRPMQPIRIERYSTAAKATKVTKAAATNGSANGKSTLAGPKAKSNGHANGHVVNASKA
jgi:hypothetical protein